MSFWQLELEALAVVELDGRWVELRPSKNFDPRYWTINQT
jgi:hypothetical protein